MARSKQHRPQHPSDVRVRRAEHVARDAEVKARKRNPTAGERARRRIRLTKLHRSDHLRISKFSSGLVITPAEIIDAVPTPIRYAVGPFTTGSKKVETLQFGLAWPIMDGSGEMVAAEPSRSAARARRDRLNAGDERIQVRS